MIHCAMLHFEPGYFNTALILSPPSPALAQPGAFFYSVARAAGYATLRLSR